MESIPLCCDLLILAYRYIYIYIYYCQRFVSEQNPTLRLPIFESVYRYQDILLPATSSKRSTIYTRTVT